MHIPDGFLTPHVWAPLDVVSGTFVAIGMRRVSSLFKEKAVPLMGVLAAFVFAGQMINIPVAGGTSGHFLGGALVGALLGPWAGVVVISVILMVQCFLFQDGGVAALGANIFNMGIVGSMGGALLYRSAMRVFQGPRRYFWSGLCAGWLAMVISAVCCTAQLYSSKVVTWSTGAAVIVGVHAVLGGVEGLVTGSVLESLARSRPDLFHYGEYKLLKRDWMYWAVLLALLGALLPFSSKWPDAIQRLSHP